MTMLGWNGDDSDPLTPNNCSTGLLPRDFEKVPVGSVTGSSRFPDNQLIPRDIWVDIIKEKKKNRATLVDIWEAEVNTVLYQNGLNYCWMYSPCMAMMILRAVQGLPFVLLSASSAAGPASGFRNVGNYISNALKWLKMNGIAPESLHPMTEISKAKYTPAVKTASKSYMIEEWWEGTNRDLDAVVSCILMDQPVCVGYWWWEHAVTLLSIDYNEKTRNFDGIGINSHGKQYKYNNTRPGFFTFPFGYGPRKFTPDEWYSIRSVTTSI